MTNYFGEIMNLKNSIVSGTIILTIAGILSRLIGFFYRIFLSRRFGEEAMGIYQLISPIIMLTYAVCISGIQSAIAKQIAAKKTQKVLYIGLVLSVFLSTACAIVLYMYAAPIAEIIFCEPRLILLIKMYAFAIPLSAIHSCINGYFLGKKIATYPAILQLIEQLARVLSVAIIFFIQDKRNLSTPLFVTVVGLVVGEIFSSAFSILFYKKQATFTVRKSRSETNYSVFSGIMKYSIPLTTTRILVGILQSIENIYIPQKLLLAGYPLSEALSQFGVLTGMALPFIMFPTALTNSLSSMLLPTVSEQESSHQSDKLYHTLRKSISFCMLLGFICLFLFFTFGRIFGQLLFHSSLAGTFIVALSFICPFMYTNSSLSATINGMGKTSFTFIINVISTSIRLFFVFFLIPKFGILAYLWGILFSQLFTFFTSFIYINHKFSLLTKKRSHSH